MPTSPFMPFTHMANSTNITLKPRLHDTTGCQTVFVKPCLSNRLYNPVWEPVERTAVCSTRLYRVNGVLLCHQKAVSVNERVNDDFTWFHDHHLAESWSSWTTKQSNWCKDKQSNYNDCK